ncbi:neuroblastoma breakpoint family member 11 [Cebus imitator]|uniref:neuroblastoma breakpoint family member 11 n=1 Tax=Cebus imitator TaxID=2715852 RepID=UPI0018974E47|nr:neuroblastoma breakpoint family member 11 [Cebus imitator]
MCLGFFSPVSGCTCGAPNVSMVASGRTCSRKTTEVNFPDIIENSYSQQEETKPNFRDSKYRLLMSQVAYLRNYQLKTYKDRKDHDEEQECRDSKNKLLMSQVAYYLGCRLKTEVPGFLCSVQNVNMVASGRPPSRNNTEVNIPEGNEKSCSQQEENKLNVGANKNRLLMSQVSYFLNYREKTYKDRKDHDEEQKCRDSKNKLLMSQVAYYLGCRLKTEENDQDEDEDVHVAEAERVEESRAPREVQKIEVKKVPEDSLEECVVTRSNSYGPPESSQPPRDTSEITFEEDSVDSALIVESESSHDVAEDALIILSESQNDDEEVEEQWQVPPRNLQESVEEEAPQESWDEGYSTLSVPPGTSAFSEPYRSKLHSLEEQEVDLAGDVDKIKNDQEEEEDQGPPCPRLSMELVEAEEPEVFRVNATSSICRQRRSHVSTTMIMVPGLFHHLSTTMIVAPGLFHHLSTTMIVVLGLFCHLSTTMTVIPGLFHHLSITMIVLPGLFHHLSITNIVIPRLFRHLSTTMIMVPGLFHHLCTTMIVVLGLLHHLSTSMIVIPGLFHHLSITMIMVPGLFHDLSITMIVVPGLFHHLSITNIVIPGLFHHLFMTIILIPGLFHDFSITMIVVPGLFHHLSITNLVIPRLFHHLSITIILMPYLYLSETPYL